MHHDNLIFHLPIHYLPKIALRLEYLLHNVVQACKEAHPLIHHYALKNLIEVIALTEKPELKGRFLKEFIRIEHQCKQEKITLDPLSLNALCDHIPVLSHVTGHFSQTIAQDLFIQSIRAAQSSPKDDAEFNCPQLHYWLCETASKRQHDLKQWLKLLKTLHETVVIYLSALRKTATSQAITLPHGFYQHAIPDQKACQILLVQISRQYNIVPKMQLSHNGVSLRLYDSASMQETQQRDVRIEMFFCKL